MTEIFDAKAAREITNAVKLEGLQTILDKIRIQASNGKAELFVDDNVNETIKRDLEYRDFRVKKNALENGYVIQW